MTIAEYLNERKRIEKRLSLGMSVYASSSDYKNDMEKYYECHPRLIAALERAARELEIAASDGCHDAAVCLADISRLLEKGEGPC